MVYVFQPPPTPEDRRELREAIKRQTKEFLARGGLIDYIDPEPEGSRIEGARRAMQRNKRAHKKSRDQISDTINFDDEFNEDNECD